MRILKVFLLSAGLVVAAGIVTGYEFHLANAQTLVSVITPSETALQPAPIPNEWIVEGDPQTMSQEIAHSEDGTAKTYIWQTTKSRFNWHYGSYEIATITDGEAFVTDMSNTEKHLGPGDVAFFPGGTVVAWRVPDHVRKIAVVKTLLPEPLAGLVRWAKYTVKPASAVAPDLGK